MGGCIVREADDGDDSDFLLAPVPLMRAHNGGSSPPGSIGGPFRLRVRFGRGSKELEGEALRALLDLACSSQKRRPGQSVENAKKPVLASHCIESLLSLQAAHREALLDLVVPVTTVMLHARDPAIRRELWEFFVSGVVRMDNMLGHLFYWALRCVAKCPQAQEPTRREAARYLDAITLSLKTWKVTNGTSVSPLIDLFDQLHIVGDELVGEKDKVGRQKLLESLLSKVNSKLPEPTRVPIQMMVPDENIRRPGCLPGSSLLSVPATEGGVLSSKARAPYHVLVEVDTPAKAAPGGLRGRFGILCCKRARPHNAPPNFPQRAGGSAASSKSADKKKDKRPKGLFKDETWDEVQARVRATSIYGVRKNWGLISLIVKSSAHDVRQEEMAYRLVKWFQRVFARHGLRRLWLRPFLILATQHDAGCLEAVPNAISIDALKKSFGSRWKSLKRYFEETFPASASSTDGSGVSLHTALLNFVESMAAYSVVCYVLSIRDRHNGNILLDDVGHIIHVDFGFMLCGAPGGRAVQQMGGFEPSRAFKLTSELMEVLDCQPEYSKAFRELLVGGLMAVRHEAEELFALLQLSLLGSENSSNECFNSPRGYPEAVLEDICDRLCLPRKGGSAEDVRTDDEFRGFVDGLIADSVDHWRSRLYDTVQYVQNGIL